MFPMDCVMREKFSENKTWLKECEEKRMKKIIITLCRFFLMLTLFNF